MSKLLNVMVFILFTYPVGMLMGMNFWLLRFFGILKVRGWQNFPKQKGKILVVSNHPSLVEPLLLVGLFFHQYALRPFRCGPWTLADRRNYYDNWKYFLMRPRLIPVDRTLFAGDSGSLVTAKHVLGSGANIIIFPEGGRTFKGTSYFKSETGKRLRALKGGFAILAGEPGVALLPVWFEFRGWFAMRLTIGKAVFFEGVPREKVVEKTTAIMLKLADQLE